MSAGSPSRRDLAALMRSTRRRHHDADGRELWPLLRLYEELTRYRDNGPGGVDPDLIRAVETLHAKGVARTHWAKATLYRAEAHDGDQTPNQGRELVQLYDELFNSGAPHLMQYWEQVRLAAPPRSEPSRLPAFGYPIPGDVSAFVCDVTVPDGIMVPPNHRFEKVWRLYNAGTVPWVDRWLIRLGPPTGFGFVRSAPRVRIADTLPDETVDISVLVTAPAVETTHCEPRWKMADAAGNLCFPDVRYGIGLVMSVVEGVDIPDMTIPAAERVSATKLARLRAARGPA
ncbi:hypothetical protein GFY24_33355 [Nocardia sp. SYP-A9097]|uniref:NBR1-Ig-like domain-containing protein n=1 Tax=Nocardia sp. SYP-A9097 TaxID=2663237 RepID=UPI00129B9776|nr:NBR1-Ig-like domain-containing protein [Nocardia sp. SYP-A9097]MRH92266.1 hypothetical protein [Nocardia sp. SYP-A9097]